MGNKEKESNQNSIETAGDLSGAARGYVAIVSETIQTSEDSWAVRSRTKVCTKDTTIGEIVEWAGTMTLPSIKSGKIDRRQIMQNVELTEAT